VLDLWAALQLRLLDALTMVLVPKYRTALVLHL
jgi:hypothetical protein